MNINYLPPNTMLDSEFNALLAAWSKGTHTDFEALKAELLKQCVISRWTYDNVSQQEIQARITK